MASKCRPLHLSALLVSLALHLFLILFLDSQIVQIRRSDSMPDHLMSIQTIPQQAANMASSAPSDIVDLRTPAIENQPPLPPPSEPQPNPPSRIVEIVLPPAPYYFRPGELTAKPKVSTDIPMNLGATLPDGAVGSAIFRMQISEQGAVDQIIVVESSFSESEERMVIDAFQKMKFEPGKIDDKSVKSELKIEITTETILPILPAKQATDLEPSP